MEVVINTCFGGYGLSHKAVMAYAERKGIKLYVEDGKGLASHHYYKVPPEQYHALKAEIDATPGRGYRELNEKNWYFSEDDIERDDPDLVAVVKEMGNAANGRFAELKVVEVPDDVEWEISEYDGSEHIAEQHRTWA